MSLVPTWPFVVGTLVIGIAAGAWADHAYMSGKYAKLVAKQTEALAQANAANQKESIELQDRVDDLNTQKVRDDEQHAKDLESVRAAARAGTVRLSIPGACRANSSKEASPAPATGAEERTDLLPGTADAVIRIAGDSAQSVRDYNQLLDQYNAVCK